MGAVSRARVPEPGRVEAVADRLHSTAIHLLRRLRRADAEAGLGAAQLSALSVVVFGGPLTLGELAAAEQVRPPTITRLVRGLEAAGLVTREPDPSDGRVVRVRATPQGERILAEGRQRRVRLLTERFRTLGAPELETLERAADLLEHLLRENR